MKFADKQALEKFEAVINERMVERNNVRFLHARGVISDEEATRMYEQLDSEEDGLRESHA